jgi:hypothetical protein
LDDLFAFCARRPLFRALLMSGGRAWSLGPLRPSPSRSSRSSAVPAFVDSGRGHPGVDSRLDPDGDGDGADAPALASRSARAHLPFLCWMVLTSSDILTARVSRMKCSAFDNSGDPVGRGDPAKHQKTYVSGVAAVRVPLLPVADHPAGRRPGIFRNAKSCEGTKPDYKRISRYEIIQHMRMVFTAFLQRFDRLPSRSTSEDSPRQNVAGGI